MHTFNKEGFIIHYNPDFSGDIIISTDNTDVNIEIPGNILLDFIVISFHPLPGLSFGNLLDIVSAFIESKGE